MYLINDVMDAERDRVHPQKRHRPVASGRLPARVALAAGVGLLIGTVAAAFLLSVPFGIVAAVYAVLLAAYSAGLKHMVIVDTLIIAGGFVLRALAGVVVLGIEFSYWLLLCTILLALFLTFGKRRHELLALEAGAIDHRPILSEYSPQLLDQMIAVVTASTLMAYALYTMAPETHARLGTTRLPLTIPFVLYGIFRYLYLMYRRDLGGNPSELFLTDRALLVDVALWGRRSSPCSTSSRSSPVARESGRGPPPASRARRCRRSARTACRRASRPRRTRAPRPRTRARTGGAAGP